jgi:hypothetical protein
MTKTYYIPGTKTEANVIDPNPMNSFVSLFLKNNETGNNKNSGSVNAGTSNVGEVFAVGLGGINGAFAKSLQGAGQHTDAYQQIHQNVYDSLSGTQLSGFNSTFAANDPIIFSMIQKPDPSFNLPQYDGIVFIDIFNPAQFPNQNLLNYSMIYVVPPNRSNYATDNDFMKAIEVSCVTIIQALSLYNTKHAVAGNPSGLKPVNNIRMCLFSGGIYRGGASQNDVANHNLVGLVNGLTSSEGKLSDVTLVDFENSYDNSTRQNVFESIKSKLSTT